MAAVLLVGTVAEVAAQAAAGGPGLARGGGPEGWALLGPGGAWASRAPTSPRRSGSRCERWSISIATRCAGCSIGRPQARRTLAASADRGQVDEAAAAEVGTATAALALAEARLAPRCCRCSRPSSGPQLQKRREAREERFAAPSRALAESPGQ